MKVKELMSTGITCIMENTPVALAALYMKKDNVGSMPVCDSAGHLKGIVTDRDIVLRALACENSDSSESALSIPVSDIMTCDPVTVSSDMSVHDAALLFSSYQIRRLPVTEASKLVGMLSLGDGAAKPECIDEAGDALSSISAAASTDVPRSENRSHVFQGRRDPR